MLSADFFFVVGFGYLLESTRLCLPTLPQQDILFILQIDSIEKLTLLLTASSAPSPEMPKSPDQLDRTSDLSCILIGFPVDEMSEDDFHITKYSYLYSDTNVDVIELPDWLSPSTTRGISQVEALYLIILILKTEFSCQGLVSCRLTIHLYH